MERLPLDDPSLNLEFLCDFCHCKLNISTIFRHSHLFSSIHTAAAQPASHHNIHTHSHHIHGAAPRQCGNVTSQPHAAPPRAAVAARCGCRGGATHGEEASILGRERGL
jgi:hypothetical protein